MSAPVPTLSSDGFVTAIPSKADRLLSYFFLSQASQSNAYRGKIASLPSLIQQYGNDDYSLRTALERTLTDMLGSYFEQVSVTVTVTKGDDTKVPGRMDVSVSVDVIDNGISYSFGRLVQVLNSKIQRIIDLNNNG